MPKKIKKIKNYQENCHLRSQKLQEKNWNKFKRYLVLIQYVGILNTNIKSL
jgi:hypothetical protein